MVRCATILTGLFRLRSPWSQCRVDDT